MNSTATCPRDGLCSRESTRPVNSLRLGRPVSPSWVARVRNMSAWRLTCATSARFSTASSTWLVTSDQSRVTTTTDSSGSDGRPRAHARVVEATARHATR